MDDIITLKGRLASAEERLERAQSCVFGYRCVAARNAGRGLWVWENDRSSLRAEIWDLKEGLGSWVLIKASLCMLSSREVVHLPSPGRNAYTVGSSIA
jgi:hypothetical protein